MAYRSGPNVAGYTPIGAGYTRMGQSGGYGGSPAGVSGATNRGLNVGGIGRPTIYSGASRRVSPPTRATPGQVPQMPYQPEAPRASGIVDTLRSTGEGLLDPNSDYSNQLRDELTRSMGDRTGAQQRAAVLRASRSGLGTGASPELLETQGDIARGGLEASEEAAGTMALQSPALGLQALAPALSGEIGLQGQRLSGFMGQQNLAAGQEAQQANLDLAYERLAQDALMRELSLSNWFG